MSAEVGKKIPAYLENELNKIAKAEGFADHQFKFEAGSNFGDGFVGDIVSVDIFGNRNIDGTLVKSSLSLICKLLPEGEVMRKKFQISRWFEREVYVYNNVFPAFRKFQDERDIADEDKFTSFPKSYFAISDDENNKHVIIMENLKTVGYVLHDKYTPMKRENVTTLMKELGKLHGLAFAIRDQNPKLFETLKQNMSNFMLDVVQDDENPFTDVFVRAYDQTIAVLENNEEIEIIKRLKDNIKDEFNDVLMKNIAEPYEVFIHGDCWNNNMMFHEKSSDKICLLDWQLTSSCSPALDISNFLLSSTDSEIRNNYKDVLLIYHNSLSSLVTKLGSDPEKLFSFKDLANQMTKFGKYGFIMAPAILQIMLSDPKNITALEDYGKDDNMVTLNKQSTKLFRERISNVIQDCIRFNYIQRP